MPKCRWRAAAGDDQCRAGRDQVAQGHGPPPGGGQRDLEGGGGFLRVNSTPATADDGLHRPDARRGVCGRVDLSGAARAGLSGRRTDLVTASGVAPDMLIDTDHLHVVEPGGFVDQEPPAFGQDRAVGGVPGHGEGLGDPGDAEVLHDSASSAQRSARRDSFERGSAAVLVSWRHT